MGQVLGKLRTLIEETNEAFQSLTDHQNLNADFAEFAGMALPRFKQVLSKPDLTHEDLQTLLRQGMKTHRGSGEPLDRWSVFMADYVTKAVNDTTPHPS